MRPAYLLGIIAGAGACTASGASVQPPDDQLQFPTGIAVAPDDSVMFVANANSELRFDSGSISVFDLSSVDDVIGAWTTNKTIPDGCSQDPDHSETLVCEEARFMKTEEGVRIGNFATEIALQDLGNGALRLIVPTRGDPSVTWADWDGSHLNCGAGEGFGLCDDTHRLTTVLGDSDIGVLPPEPFGAFADSSGEYAMVTHLTTGAVTLIDSPKDGNAQITDVLFNLFQPDPFTGIRGSTGVAGRNPHAQGDIAYVASRSESRMQMLTVGRPANDAPPVLIPGNFFFLDAVGGNSGGSSDTRGIAFSATGDQLYLVNRDPPTLQVYDTSIDDTGFPQNTLTGATDICREGSTLSVLDVGDGERVFLTCFQDGQTYVVDPRGLSSVEDIITVGRGPFAIASAPTRKKVFVSNFLEDTIAVIDAAVDSPTRNRVVLRIGTPKDPGDSQ